MLARLSGTEVVLISALGTGPLNSVVGVSTGEDRDMLSSVVSLKLLAKLEKM